MILVIAVIIFVQTTELIGDLLINNWEWLRKNLSSRAFIEGFGIDVTYNPNTKEAYYGTLNRFAYNKGRIVGEAELFNHEGRVVGNFNLITYFHNENQLKYAFEGTVAGGNTSNTQYVGYGEMRFGVHEGRPKAYTGFYIDNNDFMQHFFAGEFLWGNANLVKLEEDTQESADFLNNFIVEFCRRKGYTLAKLDLNKLKQISN